MHKLASELVTISRDIRDGNKDFLHLADHKFVRRYLTEEQLEQLCEGTFVYTKITPNTSKEFWMIFTSENIESEIAIKVEDDIQSIADYILTLTTRLKPLFIDSGDGKLDQERIEEQLNRLAGNMLFIFDELSLEVSNRKEIESLR